MVDLCCATGDHLLAVKGDNIAIGIDISLRYLKEAINRVKVERVRGVYFLKGDATNIPLETETVQTLYSLSALYVIPDLSRVLSEISRVLQRGGRCLLDLGNKHSLNAFCVSRYHHDIAPCYYYTVNELLSMCNSQKLIPIEHRAYQILPLWTTRPSWLGLLLHPIWKRILGHRIQGRMIDEWICRLPLARRFAFRHLVTCEKC
jgi:SAM-dependent methyltransferase